ncbi:hypothetical protein HMF7854_14355 [Sphingomonas ginkgonis]|uniref:Deacetylase PdaC domain-containing protein n=1 Tax=Sphingomonas ginkgonis TaxID=2315330 RepID=A0A3R9Z7V0_9SPHN|nr:DUF4163 domain-containing protein [Sphingomonas ginkgonis]RST31889.1 hypothetical protein HMF7854_14355 [Sphingomonas ginkgonis]
MRRVSIVPLLLATAACGQQAESRNRAEPVRATAEAPRASGARPDAVARARAPSPASARSAKAVSIDDDAPLLDFHYAWPAEASAIPELARRFRLDAERTKAAALTAAAQDRKSAQADGREFHQHLLHRDWTIAGDSASLLSLRGSIETFTGGAHGSHGTLSLLRNRRQNREVGIETLLAPGQSWSGAIRAPFCVLLDRERAKRRGEPVRKGDLFGDCPKANELRLLLADGDGDRRFDHVLVVADEYVAGPYAEGRYVIPLPITAAMAARIRPELRAEFRPQPPVQ